MLSTSFILALSYTIYAVFCLWPRQPSYNEKAKLFENDIFYYKGIPNFVTADIREWPLFGIYIYCYILMVVSYVIVIWTSYKVWKYLKVMRSHLSISAHELNSQVTKTLIMQALTPLLICLLPILVTVTMVFLRANIGGIGLVLSIFYSWIPIGNALVTIIAVKTYRRAIISPFSCFTKRNQVVSSTGGGATFYNSR
uniref:Uncharacterized protein n=1 Tax=Panagrolaimus superbus TaxID=310955 RepID=A0A914XW08_9BILA